MLEERDDSEQKIPQPTMGRVIDLRKAASECEKNKDANSLISGKRKLRLFWLKKKDTPNFLKPYLTKEKEQEFIEQEMMRDYLEEIEEEKKKDSLSSFFKFVSGIAKAPQMPLFILGLLWRIFSVFNHDKPKKGDPDRLVLTIKPIKEGPSKSSAILDLLAFLFSWPKLIIRFISGRTTEDYLYQRVLLDEMAKKRISPFRRLLPFMVIILVVMLPIKAMSYYRIVDFNDLKGRVLGASESAVGDIGSAANMASSLDFYGAAQQLSSAKNGFTQAKSELEKVNSLLLEIGKLAPNKKIRLASYGKDFLSAGETASSLGQNMFLAAGAFSSGSGKDLPAMIDEFLVYEKAAISDAVDLSDIMKKIDPAVLPDDRQGQFNELKTSVDDLVVMLSSASDIMEKAKIFIGSKEDKRYLLVFENNSEIRASGGFVGSFALVDISRGKIKNIEVPGGGSYDTEGGLTEFVTAPEPLWLVNPLWHFWDANWWPDWKKSAEKLEWFYGKSGGPSVDGVIAFTPSMLEKILEVIGPIDMTEKYGMVIDSDNLWINLRDVIEKEKEDEISQDMSGKEPKKIIGDLLSKIAEEMPRRINKDNLPDLISSINDSLNDKQMLFYFNDKSLQDEAEKRNWAGRIKDTSKDYLFVVNTNIAGGKSDGKMKEEITHKAEVSDDGSVIDTVTIKKTHTGVDGEPYFGVRNVNWLRVYVPMGSKLLEADGFRGPDPIYFDYPDNDWKQDIDVASEEGSNATIDTKNMNTKIYQESGKTVFANWVMVDPGKEVTITLKYKLPFKLEKRTLGPEAKNSIDRFFERFTKMKKKDLYVYSLLVQKQPGMRFSSVSSSLKTSDLFNVVWRYPAEISDTNPELSTDLDSDKYWAVLLEKANPLNDQNQ